jgi:histidine triad (HIT) family protein
MPSVFTKILQGEIPCYKVAEDDHFLAFLDINPLQKGHVLVVPKIEVDYFFDLEDDLLVKMICFSKTVARKIKQVFPCKKVGMTVIGLEVPHAHIHLVPINSLSDMDFTRNKLTLSDIELNEAASLIRECS